MRMWRDFVNLVCVIDGSVDPNVRLPYEPSCREYVLMASFRSR